MPQERLDKSAEGLARLPRAKLVLHLALLVAGLQLPLPLVRAQTATRPSTPEKLPAAASVHFHAGRRLLAQHTPKLAEVEIRAGLKLAPQSLQGLNLLGIALGEQKDFAGAGAAFQQALKINPRSPETHNTWATVTSFSRRTTWRSGSSALHCATLRATTTRTTTLGCYSWPGTTPKALSLTSAECSHKARRSLQPDPGVPGRRPDGEGTRTRAFTLGAGQERRSRALHARGAAGQTKAVRRCHP